MDYQRDKDVVKSVKFWFRKTEDKGGKSMFVEDATLIRFAPFPPLFQVLSENTNIYCMDSTHKTAKDIAPIEEGSKIHNSVYLFMLLVKDKDVHQGIPIAFMACKFESRLKTVAFMVDCAEAESHAMGTVFPEARIHYCDFHVGWHVVTTNNWIESWHARLKGDRLDGDRNLRIGRLVYILQDQVVREFRFAYLKTKRGFQPIPWRKGDEERKQKADKVLFDEAQRKIEYNSGQRCNDGRSRVWLHQWLPEYRSF
ncbi:hypothetical protein BGZ47_000346 [Haplosporangium gracile]|nr:hypothetical protein BGZ47_000346 [Haplosporangium gracile]